MKHALLIGLIFSIPKQGSRILFEGPKNFQPFFLHYKSLIKLKRKNIKFVTTNLKNIIPLNINMF
jgi:hypothetical protein